MNAMAQFLFNGFATAEKLLGMSVRSDVHLLVYQITAWPWGSFQKKLHVWAEIFSLGRGFVDFFQLDEGEPHIAGVRSWNLRLWNTAGQRFPAICPGGVKAAK